MPCKNRTERHHKFEWLLGSVYMNCKEVCEEENILKLEYITSGLESSGWWLGYYDWR